MQVSAFNFNLPPELIAQHPVTPRDSAKLLVVKDDFSLNTIADLPDFLQEGDGLVFNNSKVIPARLFSGNIEILLHKLIKGSTWQAFAKPGKKLKVGAMIFFGDNVSALVQEKLPSGEVILQFSLKPDAFREFLETHGNIPLPPYIRGGTAEEADKKHYQTIYAEPEGSVAAPTAGLHFTEKLLQQLRAKNIATAFVTLHVGAGTFQPVKVEDTSEHIMHYEYGEITAETAAIINRAKRVICVGTTSLRLVESAAKEDGTLSAWSGETNIFITPGYRFKRCDILMTNFHLPKSTLFMLVSAFTGLEKMQAAYQFAIEQRLRFYSYGDACLLYRHV
jgi:S-adenosylmethionine:tRNA ribosyltransferase-isomerase